MSKVNYKVSDILDLRAFSLDYLNKKLYINSNMNNALKPNDVLDLQINLTGLLMWYVKNPQRFNDLDPSMYTWIDTKVRKLILFLEQDLVIYDFYKPSDKKLGKDYRLNPIIFGYCTFGYLRDWISIGELFTILEL